MKFNTMNHIAKYTSDNYLYVEGHLKFCKTVYKFNVKKSKQKEWIVFSIKIVFLFPSMYNLFVCVNRDVMIYELFSNCQFSKRMDIFEEYMYIIYHKILLYFHVL